MILLGQQNVIKGIDTIRDITIRDIKNSCYWWEILIYFPLKINPKCSSKEVYTINNYLNFVTNCNVTNMYPVIKASSSICEK